MTDPLAQAALVAYCGWDPTVQAVNATVLLDGNGTFLAAVPSLNVTAVASVIVTNNDGSTYTATIGAGANDVGWGSNGILTWQSCNNGGCWPLAQRSIAVTYSGGYSPVPADLAAALAHLSNRVGSITGVASQKIDTAAVSYGQVIADGGLLAIEQMVFDSYRLPKVA